MCNKILINIISLFILFIGNIFIEDYKFYFALIYICLTFYHVYIFYLLLLNKLIQTTETKNFIIISLLLYIVSYLVICDSNPFFCIIVFYSFFPNFIKAIMIIFFHTYILNKYINNINNRFNNIKSTKNVLIKISFNSTFSFNFYFLSDIIIYIKKNYNYKYFSVLLIAIAIIDKFLFLNKAFIWVYFNKIDKTLPNLSSRNTKYYITSNIFNMEEIIEFYLLEMKKLIKYLGINNVIVSIVENGDSTDNTRAYLKEFQNYLNENQVINKFYLNNEIIDPRKIYSPFLKYSRLRIEYYAQLRNKCLDFLYELKDIDFNNTMILFFNDVVFKYEDIINLLSTNNQEYDVVCGLDMSFMFYDRWVSIDLNGEGMTKYFPYFINKEGQDLVINHKPVRVFSCWNGIIAFKAKPLKNKHVQFRYKNYTILPKSVLKNPSKTYFESECTYFNIDLHNLGYTKKFINPEVRVGYNIYYLYRAKYYIPSFKHIANYFWMYFATLLKIRNKWMSNYNDKNIKLDPTLENWYIENKLNG